MEEIWKPIEGYEGRYEVSSLGRVRSLVRRWSKNATDLLKPGISEGYYIVALHPSLHGRTRQQSWKVHRLVALAFLGPRPDGMQINHKDLDRLNNRIENLEYVTPQGNTLHAWHLGVCAPPPAYRGQKAHNATITEAQAMLVISEAAKGKRPCEIWREHGLIKQVVERIVKGDTWKHLNRPSGVAAARWVSAFREPPSYGPFRR